MSDKVTADIVTGDDVSLLAKLKLDGASFAIDSGATVKGSLVSMDKTILIAAVTVLSTEPGADWSISEVVVPFTSSATAAIPDSELGDALLEVQVDDSGKDTWFLSTDIEKGTIG